MIGIISDVHGNYPALKAVLEDLDKAGCNRIISLGDICGYYCMIKECIREFRERNIVNIMGNHDFYIANHTGCSRSYTANLCLDYQRSVLSDGELAWIKQSVSDIKINGMWMVHGGWNDFIDEYIKDFSFLEHKQQETKVYISGHTHAQKFVKGKYADYFNPGSVGQPRDYNPHAAYAIVKENYEIELRRTEYDIEHIDSAMEKAGFPKRVSSCLYKGMKIGEDEK